MLVVATHSTFYAQDRLDHGFPLWHRGVFGVDIFFVISGLVMYISSERQRAMPNGWREFAARRLVRIVPLYWLATTVNVAVLLISPAAVKHSVLDWPYVIKSYFFIPAYTPDGRIEPLLGVGWTLIFEMFFYVVFTVAMLLRLRVLPVTTVVLAACTGLAFLRRPDWPAVSLFFDPRALEFVAGMFMGRYLHNLRAPAFVGVASLVAGVAMMLFLPIAPGVSFRILTQVLPSALTVLGVVLLEPYVAGRWPKGLVFLGAMSYSLYLVHPLAAPVPPALLARLGLNWPWLSLACSATVAVAVAAVCYLFFEKPVTKVLNRLILLRKPAVSSPITQPAEARR